MEIVIFILILIGLMLILNKAFFVTIPINHFVMIEINGKPIHILGHLEDKLLVIDEINKVTDTTVQARLLKEANKIVTRETGIENILFSWAATLFNLHFKHWNPFAKLREIKVIRTEENPDYNPSDDKRDIRNYVVNKDADEGSKSLGKQFSTPYLRIRWRRVGASPGRDLSNFVTVDLAWSFSEVMIIDPKYVFITSPNPSLDFDNQVAASLNNITTVMTDEEFQNTDTGANPKSILNSFFKEIPTKFGHSATDIVAGLISIGIRVTGAFSINDYKLAGGNDELVKAKARNAAADANLEADKKAAQGKAAIISEEGKAKASALELLGAAKAKSAEALKKAIAGDAATAEILMTEAYGGNITTLVNGGGTGVILNPPAATTKPTTTTTTP